MANIMAVTWTDLSGYSGDATTSGLQFVRESRAIIRGEYKWSFRPMGNFVTHRRSAAAGQDEDDEQGQVCREKSRLLHFCQI